MIRDWQGLIGLFALVAALQAAAVAPAPPPDWRIELVAEAPAVRHPSVVCVAPDGRVFVAEDPMDISAPANATQGSIICFHPDGRRTIFATNLYAVFGMQYLEGKLYVLHNPKFSVFTDNDGVAGERTDLIESTHPNPWALDWNDHVPANFKLAMDGFFYVAVGDKGVFAAQGPDFARYGAAVSLHGGGILRLRPDGTDLEVYCTGVRNILDVALNAEDEIFTYDNTDEHQWMGRLTHMVDGGFYGYPYDFVPRRPYTLWMMADFGAGAATATHTYTEDGLPAEYHDNLFLADFGKREILRVRVERDGASYRLKSHEELFKDPPEDFRPVGIALSADGLSIYICDWAHRDTKENVEVGRLWKMTYSGQSRAAAKPSWYLPTALGKGCSASNDELLAAFSHPSKNVRLTAQRDIVRRGGEKSKELLVALNHHVANSDLPGYARWHAIWALGAIPNDSESITTIKTATSDADASVRRQAIRQLGQWGPNSASAIDVLRPRLKDKDASVRFAAATALGCIANSSVTPHLIEALDESDLFARFAIFTALNKIGWANPGSWSEIAASLRHPTPRVREGAAFALRETYDTRLVAVLESLVRDAKQKPDVREAALNLLAPLHRRRPPWKGEWWAYHPALQPPPAKSVQWSETEGILETLRDMVDDREPAIRLASVQAIGKVGDSNAATALIQRYNSEKEAAVRRGIIETLGTLKEPRAEALLVGIITKEKDLDLRRAAIHAAEKIGGTAVTDALLRLLSEPMLEGGLRLEVIEALGNLKAGAAVEALARSVRSEDDSTRLAAARALGKIGGSDAAKALRNAVDDPAIEVRREAVKALGILRDRESVPVLLAAWKNAETRQTALEALGRISDVRAVNAYLSGLESANPAVREQCRKALGQIRDEALPHVKARAKELQPTVVSELRKIYEGHQGAETLLASALPAITIADYEAFALANSGDAERGERLFFDEEGLACSKCHSVLGKGKAVGPDLTSIGQQFARPALIEHVLYPSKAVREGYAQVMVETTDGEVFFGLVQTETGETLSLVDAAGEAQTIPKRTISKRSTSSLSLMPEGIHGGLRRDQFADLIVYLESLKSKPADPSVKPGH